MAFNENKPVTNSTLNSSEIRSNFQHLKKAISKEHTWSDSNPENVQHKLDEIKGLFTGSLQRDTASGYDYTTGSNGGDKWKIGLERYIHHVIKGIPEDQYSLQSILQELVTRSHTHSVERNLYNCNCNCNCGGNN